MIKKSTLRLSCLFLFLLSSFHGSHAQSDCGSDRVHDFLMQTDSAYNADYRLMENQLQNRLNHHSYAPSFIQPAVLTFPVVVHVIHLGEAVGTGTNISDATILGALSGLNDRFQSHF